MVVLRAAHLKRARGMRALSLHAAIPEVSIKKSTWLNLATWLIWQPGEISGITTCMRTHLPLDTTRGGGQTARPRVQLTGGQHALYTAGMVGTRSSAQEA